MSGPRPDPAETLVPLRAELAASEHTETQQAALLLGRIWRFMLYLVAPVSAVSWLTTSSRWQTGLIAPVMVLLALAMRRALQRKQYALTVGILYVGLLTAVTLQALMVNGLRSPVVMAYPLGLCLTSWLVGRRTSQLALGVTLCLITVMAVFDAAWWPTQLERPIFTYWSTLALCCGLASLLALHVSEGHRRAQKIIRAARDALAVQVDDLQRTRDRLSTLANVNPVPVSVTLAADGTYCEANPAWLRLSGWSRDEMIGHRSTELHIWRTQAERDAFAAQLQRDGHVSNLPATFCMRDGQERDFLVSAETVDYDGQPAIFAAFVDITELRRTEAALATLNHQLEQRVSERTASLTQAMEILRRAQDELVQSDKLASLGAVVAGVAHELNTPIGNSVLIASTLAQDLRQIHSAFTQDTLRKSALGKHLDDAGRAIELLENALGRASHMVTSFKQVAIDQSSERRRSFALHELVRDICETLRPGMRNQAWRLDTELVEGLQLDSYPGPLGQVISNLVQNAFFHGLQENAAGTVSLHMRRVDAAQVELSVTDDGRGIAPELIGRIFDPFFTTRLGQGGSGLGLSIVYRLVTTVLGGRIQVESEPGQGCRFTVSLPVTAPGGLRGEE